MVNYIVLPFITVYIDMLCYAHLLKCSNKINIKKFEIVYKNHKKLQKA